MGMKTTTTKWFSTCTRIRTLKTKTPLNLNQTTQQNNGKWGPKICKKNSPKQFIQSLCKTMKMAQECGQGIHWLNALAQMWETLKKQVATLGMEFSLWKLRIPRCLSFWNKFSE